MRFTLACTLSLLVEAPRAQVAAPSPEPDLDAVIEQAVALAQWAAERGYAVEAGATVRRVQRARPGHHCAGLLRRIADGLADLDAETEERLRRDHAAEYATRLGSVRAASARVLARGAADADSGALVATLAWLDPQLPGLAEGLQRHDLRLLALHGPLPQDELAAARESLRELGGGFLTQLELSQAASRWPDAFGVRTRHYRLVTNLDLPLVLESARHLEAIHDAWEALAAEAGLAVQASPALLDVHLFESRATFDALVEDRDLRAVCAREVDTVGVYSLRRRIASTFLAVDDAAGRRALVENACHEAVHQLFHLRVRGRARLAAEDLPFSWAEEALCLYCETLDPTGRLGARCDDDLRRGVFCAQTDFDPLERVQRVRRGLFGDAGDYGCAALLASWLLDGRDKEARARFFAELRAQLVGGTHGGDLLPGSGDAAVREGLQDHAERVRQRCR